MSIKLQGGGTDIFATVIKKSLKRNSLFQKYKNSDSYISSIVGARFRNMCVGAEQDNKRIADSIISLKLS